MKATFNTKNTNGHSVGSNPMTNCIKEMKALQAAIANAQAKYDELKAKHDAEQSKKPWRAEVGVEYWCVRDDGEVCYDIEEDNIIDSNRHKTGNYLRTREEAEQARDASHKWRKLHRKMMLASDGFVKGENNWCGAWKYDKAAPIWTARQQPQTAYFRDPEALEKAVEEILGGDAEFYFTFQGVLV